MSTAVAGHLIDWLSVAMLVIAIGIVWTHSLRHALVLFAAQSLMLAIAAGVAGLATSTTEVIVGAALTFAIKVVAIPVILWLILRQAADGGAMDSTISRRLTVALAVGIALLFARTLGGQAFHTTIGAQRVLSTSVAVIALGLLVMVTHRHAVSQLLGFLLIENGMALAALAATYGMPLVVELGISLDLLSALFVGFAFTSRMQAIFGSLDTRHLRSLRG